MRVRDPIIGRNIVVTEEGFEEWKQNNWGVTPKKVANPSNDVIIRSGAKSGALNNKNDPWEIQRNAHAERYYNSIRNSNKEDIVSAIANNTGETVETISKVFDHLFINEYDIDKGRSRFDPDYDIAESIQRLRLGKGILDHDRILIGHESTEYDLMNIDGLSYENAHEIASKKYNYQEAIAKWKDETDGW